MMLTIKFQTKLGAIKVKAYWDDYMEEPLRKILLKLPCKDPRSVYISKDRVSRGASAYQMFHMSVKELCIRDGDTIYVLY